MTGFFNNTLFANWVQDDVLSDQLSANADVTAMIRFERALAAVQSDHGLIPMKSAANIAARLTDFAPDWGQLQASMSRDGVAVPNLVAQMRAELDDADKPYLHFEATSQDVIDTSLMLRMRAVLTRLIAGTAEVDDALAVADERWGNGSLKAVTRLRDALPFAVSDRVKIWRQGIANSKQKLSWCNDRDLVVQLGGPIGTSDMADRIRPDLAKSLGLIDPGQVWHTQRAPIQNIGHALTEMTMALAKIGQDLGLMSQDGVRTAQIKGGGSSAMAHKVNPIDAELLVALGRHMATLNAGLVQSALHEYERSGSGWTLEWLTLPDMVMTTGGALKACTRLLNNIETLGQTE